jgi:hypothetical protein
VSPRSAAEELGYTFLPSVLVGLSRAPQFVVGNHEFVPGDIWANMVDALVIPATACGSSALLSLSQSGVRIITVRENQTQMQVPTEPLGIEAYPVNSYLEAIGVLVAHKAGINPSALSPNVLPLHCLSTTDN